MVQRLLILALLIGAAAGSAGLLKWLSEEPGRSVRADDRAPDYYMEDFTTLMMKQDGKPKNNWLRHTSLIIRMMTARS